MVAVAIGTAEVFNVVELQQALLPLMVVFHFVGRKKKTENALIIQETTQARPLI
jgi:hypothetical protein